MPKAKAASTARREFYNANDIAEITGFGLQKAYNILHEFEQKGMAVRFGKSIIVRREYFDDFTCSQDGFDKVTGQRNFKVIRGKQR